MRRKRDADAMTASVDEAAVKLNVDRKTVYEGIRRGQIPHIRCGRRVLVPQAFLNRVLEQGM
jgi:excisionase family DNA binding protein